MKEKREFTPADYTIDLKGKDYLPVAARVKWFRSVFPTGTIETSEVCVDLERPFMNAGSKVNGYARFHATVRDGEGRILGQGTKTENAANFFDYVEKAETGAIGRALAAAGFGTELDQDLDEGRVVDAPRERRSRTTASPRMISQRPSATNKPDEKPTGPMLLLQPDIIEWLEQQSRRAGFEDTQSRLRHTGVPGGKCADDRGDATQPG